MQLSLLRIRFRLSLVLTGVLVLMLTSTAVAMTPQADSDAPVGAPPDWLPNVQWVMERWVPFDESRLYAVLGVNAKQIKDYLGRDDPTHSLASLALSQGVSIAGLANQVVGPRAPSLSVAQWESDQRRTSQILSQPHLSQHMLFHTFHQDAVGDQLGPILGVPERNIPVLFNEQHLSWSEIAKIGHRAKQEVFAALMKLVEQEGTIGVRLGAMPAAENRRLRARDRRGFNAWWQYRLPASGEMM